MNRKLAQLLLNVMALAILLTPSIAKAQDAAEVFTKYTNPHAICNWYRENTDFTIERETDNECMVSNGEGAYKAYTQFYYSGNKWCIKVSQGGGEIYKDCIAIPNPTSQYLPFIIIGVVVFVIIIGVASSAGAASRAKVPKVSGRGSYAWKTPDQPNPGTPLPTIEQEALEKLANENPESQKARSTGGVGVHQGEPLVNSVSNELQKLADLKQKGVLTEKEFNAAKKKLLS